MRRFLIAAVIVGGQAALAQTEPPSADHGPFQTLVDAAESFRVKAGLPGAGLLVLQNDRVLVEHYFGDYDEKTVVNIASASKWLAGATIMALVDDGKLTLESTAGAYVTEFAAAEDKSGMTVAQLFSHTSGLAGDLEGAPGPLRSYKEFAAFAAMSTLIAAPGTEFHYGGASMQVGGRIAQVALGNDEAWQDIFEDEIGRPLDLENTSWRGEMGLVKSPQIAGGARSTMREYGRFLQMILNGGELDGVRVLSNDAVEAMLTDRTVGVKKTKGTRERLLNESGYGIGCWLEEKDAAGRTISASSPGAFGFVPWIDRSRDLAVVWMIEDRQRIRKQLSGKDGPPDFRTEIRNAVDAAHVKSE